jgi:hypothetical protein
MNRCGGYIPCGLQARQNTPIVIFTSRGVGAAWVYSATPKNSARHVPGVSPLERVFHWEHIASRWRPAFSSHLVHAETGNLEWAATASSPMHSNEKKEVRYTVHEPCIYGRVEASGIGSEREADSPVCWKQWKCEQQMER